MAEIILAAVIFGLVIAGMAIGVIFGRKPIAGSCGGVGRALGEEDYVCELCGNDPNKCEEIGSKEKSSPSQNSDLGYELNETNTREN